MSEDFPKFWDAFREARERSTYIVKDSNYLRSLEANKKNTNNNNSDLINQLIKLKMENAEYKTKQDKLIFENRVMKEYLFKQRINKFTDKSGKMYTIDKDQNINKFIVPLKEYPCSSSDWGFGGLGGYS
jgi:hypothetical protein